MRHVGIGPGKTRRPRAHQTPARIRHLEQADGPFGPGYLAVLEQDDARRDVQHVIMVERRDPPP